MRSSPLGERGRSIITTVILLSAFLNVLVLSGSIYMMLVYDMVIPSRNPVSLIGLLIILIVAYAFQTGFDLLRSDLLRKVAAGIYSRYGRWAFLTAQESPSGSEDPVRDLDTVRSYLSGPGPAGLMDLPWMILYLGILFMLHVWIGVTTMIGIVVLAGLAWLTNRSLKKPAEDSLRIAQSRMRYLQETKVHASTTASLGMRGRTADLWRESTDEHLSVQQRLSALSGNMTGLSKAFRMLLQSLVLTVGALLVISDKATGGVIFASSIIGSRALAPMEATISTWKPMLAARNAWKRLRSLPSEAPSKLALPAPCRTLEVQDLTLSIPGRKAPVLDRIGFSAGAGDVLAIVGPSAAGKTTLLRAIAGQTPSVHRSIRLDGASLDQWDMDDLGKHLGYLPQDASFLSGTIAQNISRFEAQPDTGRIQTAATAADAHDMIVRLEDGYNALMDPHGAQQSGGQKQRIGLARALYGDPFLVLLDEPNSNLDAEGEAALTRAISRLKERGAITITASHRPAVLHAATHILVLRDGAVQAYGRRDDILPKLIARRAA